MKQRVEAIDTVRGFALFGILLVNMTLIQFGMFSGEQPTYVFGKVDEGANWFIQFFGTHNFISLFSFLFGISITLLQNSIIKKKNVSFRFISAALVFYSSSDISMVLLFGMEIFYSVMEL